MRALWALLLPSMLANMARLDGPSLGDGRRGGDHPAGHPVGVPLVRAALGAGPDPEHRRDGDLPRPRRPRLPVGPDRAAAEPGPAAQTDGVPGGVTSPGGTRPSRRGPRSTARATASCSALSPPSWWPSSSRCSRATRGRPTRASSRPPRSAPSPAHPTSPPRPRPRRTCGARRPSTAGCAPRTSGRVSSGTGSCRGSTSRPASASWPSCSAGPRGPSVPAPVRPTSGRWRPVAAAARAALLMGMLAFDDAQPDLGWIALTLTTAAPGPRGDGRGPAPAGRGSGGDAARRPPGAQRRLGRQPRPAGPPRRAAVLRVGLPAVAVTQAARRQHRPVPRLSIFPWAGPFVMNTIAMVVANTVLLSAIVYVAGVVGTVAWGFGPAAPGPAPAPGTIYVPMAIGSLASILSLGLILLVLLFGAHVPRACSAAGPGERPDGRGGPAQRSTPRQGSPTSRPSAPAGTEAAWWRSAFDPPLFGVRGRQRRGRPTPWVHKVTTMRFVGDHSRAVAVLFIATHRERGARARAVPQPGAAPAPRATDVLRRDRHQGRRRLPAAVRPGARPSRGATSAGGASSGRSSTSARSSRGRSTRSPRPRTPSARSPS